jgi:hypothetical protein
MITRCHALPLTRDVQGDSSTARIDDTSRDITDEILSRSILRTSLVMNDAVHRTTTDRREKENAYISIIGREDT